MRKMIIAVATLALVASTADAQAMPDWPSFMTAFSDAVKKDDFATQKDLIEKNLKHIDAGFTGWERYFCQHSLRGEAGKTNASWFIQVLEQLAIVNKSYGNRQTWLVNRVPWLRGLKPEEMQAKVDMSTIRDSAWPVYADAMRNPTEQTILKVVPEFEKVNAKAELAGDTYWAADAALVLGKLCSKIPEWYDTVYWYTKGESYTSGGHAADKVAEWRMGIAAKQSANTGKIRKEFVDITVPVAESKAVYEQKLKDWAKKMSEPTLPGEEPGSGGAKGGGGKDGGKKIPMPPAPNQHPGADMAWAEITGLKVSKLRKPLSVDTPYFRANAHWIFWPYVQVEKDATQPIKLLPGEDNVLENDGGKLMLHAGGKGKSKPLRLKAGQRPKIVEFKKVKYLDGSVGSIWHWLMEQPGSYKLNGFSLRAGGQSKTLMFKGATVTRGTVRGVKIEIHDANGNGTFNDFGVDFIAIGKGKKVKLQPLSKYITLDGKFFELKMDANGRALRTRPYDGPVAPLKFDYKCKSKPSAMIAQGTGEDAAYFYDLMAAYDKPIWVVPGQHVFHEGYIGQGKGEKRQTIWIRPGRNKPVNLQVGTLNTWEMGGSGEGFTFAFKAESRREKGKDYVVVPGKDIKIYGGGGEEYFRIMTGVFTPEVQVRKGKDGAVLPRVKMKRPERADLNETIENLWYPKTLQLKKTFRGDFFVKMQCDYKPLGKIKSDWVAGG